ncbi:MAG: serine hydrolase domain-containing protein [Burkholderiales bacterium]
MSGAFLIRGWLLAAFSLALLTGAARAEDIPDPAWLRQELEAVRTEHHLPALAAAVVSQGRIIAASAVGVRRLGFPHPVTRDDRFHLGSIAKPMTATLVALCVQAGEIDWQTTIGEMFPELAGTMQPAYRGVTVAQLLAHRSGMPYQPGTAESVTDARGRDARSRRYEYVKAALMDPPAAAPGTKYLYGGGPVLVASHLERKLGPPYETLMRERVFTPLGLTTAAFGNMAAVGTTDGPWEHEWKNNRLTPVAPRTMALAQARAPVGRNIVCSVIDLARFAQLHLDGAHGRSHFLRPETFQVMHTPLPGDHQSPGWMVEAMTWAGADTIWHNGSTGINMATCTIGVERDFAVCVMTNAGGDAAGKACDAVQFWVGDYLARMP